MICYNSLVNIQASLNWEKSSYQTCDKTQAVFDLKLSCSTDGNTTVSRSISHHWFYALKFVSKFIFSNLAEVNHLTEQINKDWFILYRISFGKVQLQATGELVVSRRIV